MKKINQNEFAASVGIERPEDSSHFLDDILGIAALLRQCVDRQGVLTRRALFRDVCGIFEAMGESRGDTRERLVAILWQLADVGDIQAVRVNGQDAWARTFPRWICLASHQAVLLSSGLSGSIVLNPPDSGRKDLVRRFDPSQPENVSAVDLLGARESSFSEWLGPPGWLPLMERLEHRVPAPDTPLCDLWKLGCAQLEEEGQPSMGADSQMRVLSGPPGGYFGVLKASHTEGRWTDPGGSPDGCWLAVKPGYNEAHWQPALVKVHAGLIAKVILLDNWDEWCWLLLARGLVQGDEEHIEYEPATGRLRLTFRAPHQLRTVLSVCGWHVSGWTWQIAPGNEECHWQFWRCPC